MVRPIVGWTERGDEYRIVGGGSYIKEDGCYQVLLTTVDRIYEFWTVSAKDLSVEKMEHKLQGPLEVDKVGPFGRKFLQKYGILVSQTRLPPKHS
jgi:hypothetical protein